MEFYENHQSWRARLRHLRVPFETSSQRDLNVAPFSPWQPMTERNDVMWGRFNYTARSNQRGSVKDPQAVCITFCIGFSAKLCTRFRKVLYQVIHPGMTDGCGSCPSCPLPVINNHPTEAATLLGIPTLPATMPEWPNPSQSYVGKH